MEQERQSVKSVIKLTLKEVELVQGMDGFQNFRRKLWEYTATGKTKSYYEDGLTKSIQKVKGELSKLKIQWFETEGQEYLPEDRTRKKKREREMENTRKITDMKPWLRRYNIWLKRVPESESEKWAQKDSPGLA